MHPCSPRAQVKLLGIEQALGLTETALYEITAKDVCKVRYVCSAGEAQIFCGSSKQFLVQNPPPARVLRWWSTSRLWF